MGGVHMSIRDPPKKKSVPQPARPRYLGERRRPDRKDLDHWFRVVAVLRGMPASDGCRLVRAGLGLPAQGDYMTLRIQPLRLRAGASGIRTFGPAKMVRRFEATPVDHLERFTAPPQPF
jgi:hypothetical protein